MATFFSQDYHCHLTNSEVVGYLAGKFDPQSHRKCAWGLELQGCLEKSLKWLLINYQILNPNFLVFSCE